MSLVWFMSWSDVDPARHALDCSVVHETATEVVTGSTLDRDQIERQLETALIARCGTWISGWNWAASEPGSGGVVRAWCCHDHSVLPEGEDGPKPTTERVVAAASE